MISAGYKSIPKAGTKEAMESGASFSSDKAKGGSQALEPCDPNKPQDACIGTSPQDALPEGDAGDASSYETASPGTLKAITESEPSSGMGTVGLLFALGAAATAAAVLKREAIANAGEAIRVRLGLVSTPVNDNAVAEAVKTYVPEDFKVVRTSKELPPDVVEKPGELPRFALRKPEVLRRTGQLPSFEMDAAMEQDLLAAGRTASETPLGVSSDTWKALSANRFSLWKEMSEQKRAQLWKSFSTEQRFRFLLETNQLRDKEALAVMRGQFSTQPPAEGVVRSIDQLPRFEADAAMERDLSSGERSVAKSHLGARPETWDALPAKSRCSVWKQLPPGERGAFWKSLSTEQQYRFLIDANRLRDKEALVTLREQFAMRAPEAAATKVATTSATATAAKEVSDVRALTGTRLSAEAAAAGSRGVALLKNLGTVATVAWVTDLVTSGVQRALWGADAAYTSRVHQRASERWADEGSDGGVIDTAVGVVRGAVNLLMPHTMAEARRLDAEILGDGDRMQGYISEVLEQDRNESRIVREGLPAQIRSVLENGIALEAVDERDSPEFYQRVDLSRLMHTVEPDADTESLGEQLSQLGASRGFNSKPVEEQEAEIDALVRKMVPADRVDGAIMTLSAVRLQKSLAALVEIRDQDNDPVRVYAAAGGQILAGREDAFFTAAYPESSPEQARAEILECRKMALIGRILDAREGKREDLVGLAKQVGGIVDQDGDFIDTDLYHRVLEMRFGVSTDREEPPNA